MLTLRKWRNGSLRRHLVMAVLATLILTLLTLVACGTTPLSSLESQVGLAPGTPEPGSDQAILAAAQTQAQLNADAQAAGTAEAMRAAAQAVLDSANATLSAVQAQDQNNPTVIAAQIAATAELIRAQQQATLVVIAATQNAALTQAALQQTQVQFALQATQAAATQVAQAVLLQQLQEQQAAGTQTAVADNIATQTQVAVATSQWYADQSRQRQQAALNFVWMWALPVFLVLIGALAVWGFFRWLKVQSANQPNPGNPADQTIPPAAGVNSQQSMDLTHYPDGEDTNRRYRLTRPSDPVRRWLEEVKRKLQSSDKKEENDTPDE